jgi:Domain of unknown function (DUF4365)
MLPDTQIQEELSRAYIYSIASKAGFTFERPTLDYDSVDVKISAIGKLEINSILESPTIEIQAKATYVHSFNEKGILAYPLNIKNYNDLRKNTHCPRILVVYLMPEDKIHWIDVNHDKLELRKCAYWISLKGMEDTDNKDNKTIHIPKQNIFNERALTEILIKVSKGEELNNAV